MKLFKLVFVSAFLTLFAIACSNTNTNTAPQPSPGASPAATNAATPSPTPDALAAVRATYTDSCANCHKEDGEGGMVKVEDKRLKVPALTKGHALNHTDEQLAKQIAEGGEGMPAFKDKLKPEQINDLVRFIRTQFQAGAAAPANAQTDKTVPKDTLPPGSVKQ
ncbi:MAG: cytochrome c [Acidobacteria bacterium]|nr:cytochrome c [Acidobacteriota bacterium]